MTEFDRNQEVAETICRDYCWNGRQFKLGEYVALLDGEVVAVADSPEEAISALQALDPEPLRGMVVPVQPPSLTVIRWTSARLLDTFRACMVLRLWTLNSFAPSELPQSRRKRMMKAIAGRS
jgi:hypothetical protein